MDKDFSGFQLYRKWDGTLLFARQIENGKIVKRFIGINNLQKSSTGITAPSAREICETYCTWSYEQTCYYSVTDESITETCGAWVLVDTYCWQECYDDGDDGGGGPTGDPCIDYGDCGDGNGDDPPTNPDPCQQAQAGSLGATALAGNSVYSTAKSSIMTAFANDGNEHGISFGKDANGNIISSSMSTGGTSSGNIPPIGNQFADLHNHPSGNPPSSGDLYGFIEKAANNHGYIRYIVTSAGNVYALVLTDPVAAASFINQYPKVQNPGFEPTFPDDLVDEEREIRYGYGATEEMSFAFILSKYNAGVALLKQDTDGNFKRLNTEEITDSNGSKTYTSNNCQ